MGEKRVPQLGRGGPPEAERGNEPGCRSADRMLWREAVVANLGAVDESPLGVGEPQVMRNEKGIAA